MKPIEHKLIKLIFSLGALIFGIWGIITVFQGDIEMIYDRFFTSLFFLLGLLLYKKMYLRLPVVLFFTGTFILHHLKLYSQVYFGWLQFDIIMHTTAGAAIAMICYSWIAGGEQERWSTGKIGAIAFLLAAGAASLNEVIEYFGYAFLGSGEGLLYFGAGDFGEYADTAWDLFSNTIGAMIGIFVMIISRKIQKKKKLFSEEKDADYDSNHKKSKSGKRKKIALK